MSTIWKLIGHNYAPFSSWEFAICSCLYVFGAFQQGMPWKLSLFRGKSPELITNQRKLFRIWYSSDPSNICIQEISILVRKFVFISNFLWSETNFQVNTLSKSTMLHSGNRSIFQSLRNSPRPSAFTRVLTRFALYPSLSLSFSSSFGLAHLTTVESVEWFGVHIGCIWRKLD